MNKLQNFDKKDLKFVGWNILLAIVVGVLVLLILLIWLKKYTQHGVEIEVADVTGMSVSEAESVLDEQGLVLNVIDSTYSSKVPFGTIVDQNPKALSHAKKGREVYVIINATSRPQIVMPNMQDMSSRQAATTLRNLGLSVDTTFDYEPSAFRDLVLDVKSGGKSIEPGTKLAQGTRVRLVVGYGRGTQQVTVPSVIGLNLQSARSMLLSHRLTVGAVQRDEEQQDGVEQVVYRQSPSPGEMLVEGETVALYLSSDIEKAVLHNNAKDDKEEDSWF
jgi:beta-lactam-binding protein with PASTA domain